MNNMSESTNVLRKDKRKYLLHDFETYPDIRAFIETIGDKYRGKNAFSFRKSPFDKEAVRIKYEQLRDDVRALACEFALRGYSGKHVALVSKLTYNWVLVYYATMAIGAVLVPLDPEWHDVDLADTASRADVSVVVCEKKIIAKGSAMAEKCACELISLDGEDESGIPTIIEAGRAHFAADSAPYYESPIDPNALSLLVFTSGTTGKGKGVMLTQRNFMSCLETVVPYIDFAPKSLVVLPPHHTYGSSVCIFGHNLIGIESYISGGLKYIMKEMKEEKPGHLILVPLYLETFYRKITASIKEQGKEKTVAGVMKLTKIFGKRLGAKIRRRLLGSILAAFGGDLSVIISGGAAINQDIIDFFHGLGIEVLNGYGITECAPIIAVNYNKHIVNGSVGDVLDCNTVKIVSDDDVNDEGEIVVKGTNVMLGYYGDEKTTAEAFDDEGNFRTGDYGRLDKNGVLYITGRKKNLIILSNGKNVYPEEIENEFAAIPGMQDIIVYEGQSKRGISENKIVAEIYPDYDTLKKNGVEDAYAYFKTFVDKYNKTCVSYKTIGMLRIRTEEFPKNTLRKIMRFKLDMTID